MIQDKLWLKTKNSVCKNQQFPFFRSGWRLLQSARTSFKKYIQSQWIDLFVDFSRIAAADRNNMCLYSLSIHLCKEMLNVWFQHFNINKKEYSFNISKQSFFYSMHKILFSRKVWYMAVQCLLLAIKDKWDFTRKGKCTKWKSSS